MSRLSLQERRYAAKLFCNAASTEIKHTQSLIQESARTLLQKLGHLALSRNELERAFEHLSDNKLLDLLSQLRDKASRFVESGVSAPYWLLIDAIGFFHDATGMRWPYMTEAGRKSSLTHAKDCANEAMMALN